MYELVEKPSHWLHQSVQKNGPIASLAVLIKPANRLASARAQWEMLMMLTSYFPIELTETLKNSFL